MDWYIDYKIQISDTDISPPQFFQQLQSIQQLHFLLQRLPQAKKDRGLSYYKASKATLVQVFLTRCYESVIFILVKWI